MPKIQTEAYRRVSFGSSLSNFLQQNMAFQTTCHLRKGRKLFLCSAKFTTRNVQSAGYEESLCLWETWHAKWKRLWTSSEKFDRASVHAVYNISWHCVCDPAQHVFADEILQRKFMCSKYEHDVHAYHVTAQTHPWTSSATLASLAFSASSFSSSAACNLLRRMYMYIYLYIYISKFNQHTSGIYIDSTSCKNHLCTSGSGTVNQACQGTRLWRLKKNRLFSRQTFAYSFYNREFNVMLILSRVSLKQKIYQIWTYTRVKFFQQAVEEKPTHRALQRFQHWGRTCRLYILSCAARVSETVCRSAAASCASLRRTVFSSSASLSLSDACCSHTAWSSSLLEMCFSHAACSSSFSEICCSQAACSFSLSKMCSSHSAWSLLFSKISCSHAARSFALSETCCSHTACSWSTCKKISRWPPFFLLLLFVPNIQYATKSETRMPDD